MENSLDRNITGRSTLTCSSKNLRDACSSLAPIWTTLRRSCWLVGEPFGPGLSLHYQVGAALDLIID
jgi:hypothetical protein